MLNLYVEVFSRVVIGLTFIYSLVGKLINFSLFVETIKAFRLIPGRISGYVAAALLSCESLIVVLILKGGGALTAGFALALCLLGIFSGALILVLVRRLPTSCNCFGAHNHTVSSGDLLRNALFIACAGGGYWSSVTPNNTGAALNLGTWLLSGLAALVVVAIVPQLGEVAALLQQH